MSDANGIGRLASPEGPDTQAADIENIFLVIRRRYAYFIVGSVIGIVLGLIVALTAEPLYTSSIKLLIDHGSPTSVADQQFANVVFDTMDIDSQVEILKSDKLAGDVIDALKLDSDPEFNYQANSFFTQLSNDLRFLISPSEWTGKKIESGEEQKLQWRMNAIRKLATSIEADRVGKTYVLEVSFTSNSPYLAERIADAYGEAYIADQISAHFGVSKLSTEWLFKRIDEIKAQSIAADLRVQRFKSNNNLISTDGKLVDEQQLQQLNTAFIAAHGDTARAQARYERIQHIIDGGDMEAAVSEALNNNVISTLREKYLVVAKSYNALLQQLGANHLQIINMQNEMNEYKHQIFDELRRISESYKSEFDIAKAGEKSLIESLKGIVGVNAANNEVMVQLRSLQSEADTLKKFYEDFLAHYQETVQQQTKPFTQARIITVATPNKIPTKPKKTLILLLSAVVGLSVGGVGAFLRELLDKGFQTRQQVRDILGLDCLALLPKIKGAPVRRRAARQFTFKNFLKSISERFVNSGSSPAEVDMMRYALSAPMSNLSEGLRSGKVAIDTALNGKKTKIVGIISTFPGEGKSTISSNLSGLIASTGARVLLIDGDMRNHGLSRSLKIGLDAGILEALSDIQNFDNYLFTDTESGLDILPVHAKKHIRNTSEILSSQAMSDLLEKACETYNYIIIDLPPLGPVVDVRAAANLFDAFILLIEWDETQKTNVISTLEGHPQIYDKCLGVFLNKVDSQRIKLYEYYGSYYYKRYSRYYRDEYIKPYVSDT